MKGPVFFGALAAGGVTLLLGATFAVASQTVFVLGSTTNLVDSGTAATAQNVDGAGGIDTPTDEDSASFIGIAPGINVEKLVSVDGKLDSDATKVWYFTADNGDTVANINAST